MKYSKYKFKRKVREPAKPDSTLVEQFNKLLGHPIELKQHRGQYSHKDRRNKSDAAGSVAIKKAYIFKTYGLLKSAGKHATGMCVHLNLASRYITYKHKEAHSPLWFTQMVLAL